MTNEDLNETNKDLVGIVISSVSGFLVGYFVLGPLLLKIFSEEEEICENYFEYEGERGTVRIKWQA